MVVAKNPLPSMDTIDNAAPLIRALDSKHSLCLYCVYRHHRQYMDLCRVGFIKRHFGFGGTFFTDFVFVGSRATI